MSTRMAGPPELMELENDFAKTLRSVNGFHIQGRVLKLLCDDQVVAEFQTE